MVSALKVLPWGDESYVQSHDISLEVWQTCSRENWSQLAGREECGAVPGSSSLEWRSGLCFMFKEGNGRFWVEEHSLWKMSVELQSINSVQGTEGCLLSGFYSKEQTVAVYCGTYRCNGLVNQGWSKGGDIHAGCSGNSDEEREKQKGSFRMQEELGKSRK